MMRKVFFAGFAALMMAGGANAGVIVGVLPNPTSTAGVATSTRSGAGSWQLYAIEDAAATDLGISGYSITLTGATAINHRSPNGSANNVDGDPQSWGFTGLRSGTNANPIVASQPLPGTSTYLITGFGQEANSAAVKLPAIDAATSGIAATSGASWGTYNPGPSKLGLYETQTGHKWVFIGEGLGPITVGSVAVATFTGYANTNGTSIALTTSSIVDLTVPEPATVALLGIALVGGFGMIRRRS